MADLWHITGEPLAKLMSGDRLPHFGPFPGLNFAPWNHHAAHSIPKMVSKRDCRSSTQSFARGSGIYGILPADVPLKVLLRMAESALKGGVRILQLRDKKQGYKRTLERAQALRDLVRVYGGIFIVNDSVQLAVTSGADGVHLGRGDMKNIARLRTELNKPLIIGISCKADATFARHVLDAGANYVSFGAVFPSSSKADATPIGLPRLTRARHMLPMDNICAIGGITLALLPAVKAAGADCAAVISTLFGGNDIESMARKMVETWQFA